MLNKGLAVFAAIALALASSGAAAQSKRYLAYVAALPPEGDAPTAEYVQAAVIDYFRLRLRDAETARYEWGSITPGGWKGFGERHGTPGWVAGVQVNAKNAYGAYTGFTGYKFVFRSGHIVEVYEQGRGGGWIAMIGMRGQIIPPLPAYSSTPPTTSTETP